MKVTSKILLFALVIAFSACSNGIKVHDSGLKYQFYSKNTEAIKPEIGDIVSLKFSFTNEQGVVVEESDLFRTQLKAPSHAGGSIEDALAMMHVGDSALFLIKAEDYYTQTRKIRVPSDIDPVENLHFYIKLINVMSFDDFEQERHAARISNERFEDKLLNDYLARANIVVEPTASGMYFVEKEKGTGPAPVPGNKVLVNYMGYFIDGKIFDSSYDRNEAFEFILGVGDLIIGLDEGVSKMKEGGKAQLIIPSSLAYGSEQVGPIPPYATLIFDIELVKAYQ